MRLKGTRMSAMSEVGSVTTVAPRQALPAKQVLAVVVGNAIEFYDFVTYAFFAAQIGRAFFPSHAPGASLLASLATFGAGFLTRPLGAFVIGRMGDRVGRKPAMLLSFTLIGIAVVGLPLTPSYASIGIAAYCAAPEYKNKLSNTAHHHGKPAALIKTPKAMAAGT